MCDGRLFSVVSPPQEQLTSHLVGCVGEYRCGAEALRVEGGEEGKKRTKPGEPESFCSQTCLEYLLAGLCGGVFSNRRDFARWGRGVLLPGATASCGWVTEASVC